MEDWGPIPPDTNFSVEFLAKEGSWGSIEKPRNTLLLEFSSRDDHLFGHIGPHLEVDMPPVSGFGRGKAP